MVVQLQPPLTSTREQRDGKSYGYTAVRPIRPYDLTATHASTASAASGTTTPRDWMSSAITATKLRHACTNAPPTTLVPAVPTTGYGWCTRAPRGVLPAWGRRDPHPPPLRAGSSPPPPPPPPPPP